MDGQIENATFVTLNETTVLSPPSFIPPLPPMHPPPQGLPVEIISFKKYAYLVTTVVGIVGNMFIFYIFTRTKLKKPSTARYLAAVAIADSGFLLTIMADTLTDNYDFPVKHVQGICQLVTFGNFVFPFLSTWYLTSVIVEKYIGVTWPRKKSRMCTVFRAKCVIICLAVLSVVCYLYTTYFFGVFPPFNVCGIFFFDPRVREAWFILTRMDAVINFAVPYIVIFILSCLIAYRSWRYHQQSQTAGERFLRRRVATSPEDKEFKTTPMLLLLALCTMIFCTPNNSSNLRGVFRNPYVPYFPNMAERSMTIIFHYLSVLNNAIKIVVYIASSTTFVKQMGKLFCQLGRKLRRPETNELQTCQHNSFIEVNHKKMPVIAIDGNV